MSCRKWFVRGLVVLVLAGCLGAGVVYQQWTNPTAVRQQVVSMLEKQFPGAIVTLDGARLRLLGGVVLTELRILRRGDGEGDGQNAANADKADVVHIPQATVYHDKERLLDGKFAVRRIEMFRPRVHIVRGTDGKWNVQDLVGKDQGQSEPLPTIVIQQGTVIVEDQFAGPARWVLHDVSLTLVPDASNELHFTGTGQSETVGTVEVLGTWNRVSNAATLALHVHGLWLNKDLVQYVSCQWKNSKLDGLKVDGKADIDAEVVYQPGAVPSLQHKVSCQLRQTSVEHPDLPLPLHNLSASVRCGEDRVILERLKAAAGTGKIECNGWVDPADPENTYAVELTAHYLPLTKELATRLHPDAKKLHDLFQPFGTGKVAYFAEKRHGQWVRRYGTLEPDDLSICFKHFPYTLDRIKGVADYDFPQKASKFEMVGYTGDQQVSLRGTWKGRGIDSDATIEIAGQNVPLDEKLLLALPNDKKELAKKFHPTGKGDLRGLIRCIPGTLGFHQTYQVHFTDCTLKWDEFPYPVENVNGDLLIQPRTYEFSNFRGTHNGGEVSITGKQDGKLVVQIAGRNIALDSDLKEALVKTPSVRKMGEVWDSYQPAGRFNFQAQVEQLPGPDQPREMDISVDVAGCAIHPSFFPYALHDVTGNIRYHDNKIELTHLTARHNTTQLSIEKGTADINPRGGFYLVIDELRGNPVMADDELLRALPEKMRTAAETIHLRNQPFALQTKLVVAQTAEPGKPLSEEIFWDGQLWVHDAQLHAGIELDHVTGTVACRGLYNGKQITGLSGNLYLNEATVFKQPFQRVRSHFWVNEDAPAVMLFDLQAPLFGGDISGQGRLDFRLPLRYEVDLTASQVRLEEFGRHNLGPQHELAGIAAGRLHLQGQGGDVSGLEGNGNIDIPSTPMTRLLNLPLLLDLLKFLGLRWPDRTAFEEAHAVFAIQDKRVSISKLDLLGSAVSLYGQGEVNLDGTDLYLDMYSGWGRAEQLLPSAVRSLPSAISKQLLRIEVQGKVGGNEGDLKFSKRPVPVLVDPLMEIRDRMIGK